MKTRLRQRFPSTRILLLSLFIAAIGFGCGGGGGGGAPTYTIGGSVTGLTGTGFVLQNNGGNDLSVSSNGSFTFTVGLTNNAGYSVSIKTQPTNQTCTITSGSGTVASSNISTVSISCTLKDQDASGLYNGSGTVAFTLVQSGQTITLKDVKGIIDKNRFMFFNIDSNSNKTGPGGQDANVLIDGTITSITKSDWVGTASIYRAGEIVSNNVAVTGTVTTRSQISLTLAAAKSTITSPIKTTGDFKGGSITGVFDSGYDQSASLAIIDTTVKFNTWGSNLISDIYHLDGGSSNNGFSVDKTNGYYSNNANGATMTCQYNGLVSIPNSAINIYTTKSRIAVTNIITCPDLGGQINYTGLAAVFTNTNATDYLWYASTNGTYSVYVLLDRLNK